MLHKRVVVKTGIDLKADKPACRDCQPRAQECSAVPGTRNLKPVFSLSSKSLASQVPSTGKARGRPREIVTIPPESG
ncbi:MAG: hypothetical protein Q4A71_04910 [Actinomycetaceae bacterium]|nr:hypothetical protein [Actinomycetaceae bacterium]